MGSDSISHEEGTSTTNYILMDIVPADMEQVEERVEVLSPQVFNIDHVETSQATKFDLSYIQTLKAQPNHEMWLISSSALGAHLGKKKKKKAPESWHDSTGNMPVCQGAFEKST